MKVLVTGGGGFIGSHVCEYYAWRDDEVKALDNLSRAALLGTNTRNANHNWEYLSKYPNVQRVIGDIRDSKALEDAATGCDLLVHTAAQSHYSTSVDNPRLDFETNATGTINILEAARKNDATVVYCSTNKVYGENINAIPIRENALIYEYANGKYSNGIGEDFPIDTTRHSPFGASKLSGDIYVQEFAHTYGLKTGVFRQSAIYGERQFGVEAQGWVAWMTIATITGKPITVYGSGKQVRDCLYVTDLVRAFDMFVRSSVNHGVYNIGGGQHNILSPLKLFSLLEELTYKKAKVSYSDWRATDQKLYISDISKLHAELNWVPLIPLKQGVEKLVSWVSHNMELFD